MSERSFTRASDRSERTPLNSEVWLCPQCNTRGDLVTVTEGVILRCGKCGLVSLGRPVPNFDVE